MMNGRGKIDLHTHSSASDGLFSPAELVEIVASHGLSAVALTDHDTLKGLGEASTAAKKKGIDFVPGVEISSLEDGQELHILGYFPKKPEILAKKLSVLQEQRYERMKKVITRLRDLGYPITFNEVIAEAGGAAPGRLHLARLMVKKNYVSSVNQAFYRFLKRGGPAYSERQTLNFAETIDLLKKTGSIPVIAHPGTNARPLIDRLISFGLMGIEVFHPDHNYELTNYYLGLAHAKSLIVTGGTDFHGTSLKNPDYPVELTIKADYLMKLKKAAAVI
ncbi:MAG TPA: PHP domain-containing protein [Firmicutes bacterium]|nr:PHP domain-containing protein [Bacillota bacterium]